MSFVPAAIGVLWIYNLPSIPFYFSISTFPCMGARMGYLGFFHQLEGLWPAYYVPNSTCLYYYIFFNCNNWL